MSVKTIAVPKGSRAVNALLDQAREEDVLVRAGDGTQFLVKAIDDFEAEIKAQRRNKRLMALLEEKARSSEWITLEEVERRLDLPPRKGRRRGTGTAAARAD